MKNLRTLDKFRLTGREVMDIFGSNGDHTCGAFIVSSCVDYGGLRIIASIGEGWEHVSVSRISRCPNWAEMCQIKNLFFEPSECVVQYHPPADEYVNHHPYCLHLWRLEKGEFPMPPKELVGPQ